MNPDLLSPRFCPARENPFASERLAPLRYRFGTTSLSEIFARFEMLHFQGSLVAPEGHGKTTLQKELALIWPSENIYWIKLRHGMRKLPSGITEELFGKETEEKNRLICVDGAEQLSWWNWKHFRSRIGKKHPCLITSHREGLLPTIIQCETSLSLLKEIVTELSHPPNQNQQAVLASLFQQHQGDIRQCLRGLYDLCSVGKWPRLHNRT